MKMTKKVLSLVLTLAMLLTVASFPATVNAAANTVYLEASDYIPYTKYNGPLLIARPSGAIFEGDTIAFPAGGATLNTNVLSAKMGLVAGDTITGFEVLWGKTPKEVTSGSNVAYVGIDTDGKMTGFYPSVDDMKNGTNAGGIKLSEAGTYMFVWGKHYNAAYEEVTDVLSNKNYINGIKFEQAAHAMRWTVEVIADEDRDTIIEEPDKNLYNLSGYVSQTRIESSITADPSTATTNVAYVNDVTVEGIASDAAATSAATSNYTTVKVNASVNPVRLPVDSYQIDFSDVSYVQSFGINTEWGFAGITYDLMGSLDGEHWYYIEKNVENINNNDNFTLQVDAVVKHLKVKFLDFPFADNEFSDGSTKFSLRYMYGQIGVSLAGGTSSVPASSTPATSSEPTSSTPVSSEPTSSVPTSSVPTSSEPTSSTPVEIPEVEVDPKEVELVVGADGLLTVPTGVEVLVGDTVKIPLNTEFTSNGSKIILKTWSNFYIHKEYSGTKVKKWLSTKDGDGNYIDNTLQTKGTFTITEPGTFTSSGQWIASVDGAGKGFSGPIFSAFTVSKKAAGASTSSEPVTAETGYGAKEFWLEYNPETNRFKVPDNVTPRVGDTLRFDLKAEILTTLMSGYTPTSTTRWEPLFNSTTLTMSKDLNKNGSISSSNLTAGVGELTYYATWPRTSSPSTSQEVYKDPAYLAKNEALYNGIFVIEDLGPYQGWRQAKDGYKANPTGEWALSYWLEEFTVTETAFDPDEVRPTSNEILDRPKVEARLGAVDYMLLTWRVKMVENKAPEFVFSNGVVPTITADGADVDGYYFIVSAKVPAEEDVITFTVDYGKNFRLEVSQTQTFTRTKSDELFSLESLEGNNSFTLSTNEITLKSNEKFNVMLSLELQNFVEGNDRTVVIDGVKYTDLRIEVLEVKSAGGRLNAFTFEDFWYNKAEGCYQYLGTVAKSGVDQFTATLELIGKTPDGEYEVIEERLVSTPILTINPIPADVLANNHKIGGSKVKQLIKELKEVYGDKSYVVVDIRPDSLTPTAVKDPESCAIFAVDWELWNALIDMNKDYIEFRLHANSNDEHYFSDRQIKGWSGKMINTVNYSIRIDKANHSMMQLEEGQYFRIGMNYNKPSADKVTGNSMDTMNDIKKQLGNGYQPLTFGISWWVPSVPFAEATVKLELPEFWTKRNGSADIKMYNFSLKSTGGVTLKPFREGLKVNDRFDYELEFKLSGTDFYKSFVLVGDDGTVERPGDTTGKNNAATGGADMTCVAVTFAAIALGTVAFKKRKH